MHIHILHTYVYMSMPTSFHVHVHVHIKAHITRYTLHIPYCICHKARLILQIWHLTPHMSYFENGKSYEPYRICQMPPILSCISCVMWHICIYIYTHFLHDIYHAYASCIRCHTSYIITCLNHVPYDLYIIHHIPYTPYYIPFFMYHKHIHRLMLMPLHMHIHVHFSTFSDARTREFKALANNLENPAGTAHADGHASRLATTLLATLALKCPMAVYTWLCSP